MPNRKKAITARRIAPDTALSSLGDVRTFSCDLRGLNAAMDLDWIATLGSDATAGPQTSIAGESGSGTPAPDISVAVNDVGKVHQRAKPLRHPIEHDLTGELCCVRRVHLVDPSQEVLNTPSRLEAAASRQG